LRVGIIGAGVAGLAAARALHRAGTEVVVFEKSRGFGGRCATRRVGDFTFDTGATSIAPRGRPLEAVMTQELDSSDLVVIEKPIYHHQYGRITPGDAPKFRRYAYRSGMTKLAKLLGEGLSIRFETRIESLEKVNGTIRMGNEEFDAVILACPTPQAQALLESVNESRSLANTRFRPCLSLLLGYDLDLGDVPYCAVIDPEQRSPLTWLSVESAKSPGRAPTGSTALVAQMGPEFSRANETAEDSVILNEALATLARLFGPKWESPSLAEVKRWKYSQPETTALFDTVNRPGSKIIIAGDGVMGPRVEFAYESGVQAAKMLLEE